MLIIREEQLAALVEDVRARFVRALCREMRERFPVAAELDPDRLESFVRSEAVKAVACGIDTERGVTAFVPAAWQLGAGFDRTLRGPGAAFAVAGDSGALVVDLHERAIIGMHVGEMQRLELEGRCWPSLWRAQRILPILDAFALDPWETQGGRP